MKGETQGCSSCRTAEAESCRRTPGIPQLELSAIFIHSCIGGASVWDNLTYLRKNVRLKWGNSLARTILIKHLLV
jgi:hypothetical protein